MSPAVAYYLVFYLFCSVINLFEDAIGFFGFLFGSCDGVLNLVLVGVISLAQFGVSSLQMIPLHVFLSCLLEK